MLDRFIELLVKGDKHPYYDWTVAYADKMCRLITGEDLDPLMRQFEKRESDDLFQQRKLITQHITKSVSKNLMKPMKKVPRCNRSERTVFYEDSFKKDILEGILSKFWGNRSMDYWMNSRFIELANVDPNTFVVIEWRDYKKTEYASPYPFEVRSRDAIYYEYDMDILQFLITKLETKVDNKDHVRYTLYDKDRTYILDQVIEPKFSYDKEGVVFEVMGLNYVFIKSKYFLISEPTPHNLGYVPAFVVGYERHLDKQHIYVSGIDDAEPILMKLIKATSELDLTMALHAFPQKLQYVKRCIENGCSHGKLPDGTVCGNCKGEGVEPIKSAQESILLELPRLKEDMINLDGIVHYVAPSVDLIKFQEKYVDNLTARCKQAVYNAEIFTRSEFTETATAKNLDYQNIYDALYPLATDYVIKWEWLIGTISDITDMDEGLIYSYFIPKDMQMKPTSELYMDLKTVSDAKADPFVKQGINDAIASYTFQDNSYENYRYMTRQKFYPFSGKSREEIMILITTGLVTDFNKVFYANYGTILDELARKYKGFYRFGDNKQWELITESVNILLKELIINDYTEPEGEDNE